MQKIVDFIIENYRLIADFISIVFVIVFFIIKKKPIKIVDSIYDYINYILPSLINDAEATVLKGKDKKDFVVNRMLDYISKIGNVDVSIYKGYIESQIENILSTPKKHS